MKNKTLSNDVSMPIIGLGTWQSKDEEAYQAVYDALQSGYRHIDTASAYGNEEEVGRAIKDSGVPREEIFVTTKLWNSEQGYESTLKSFEQSLDKLQLEYVDLYLIHWFKGYELMEETWKAFEEIYESGRAKAIGVSNFNIHHLQHLLDVSTVKPMVNQVETHIALQNHFLHNFCKKNGIQFEAYAPLMSSHISELLENKTLQSIANKHKKSVPQVAIRWFIEREIIVIPKSTSTSHIQSNYDVFDFELAEDDMNEIRSLNSGKKYFPEFDNVDY